MFCLAVSVCVCVCVCVCERHLLDVLVLESDGNIGVSQQTVLIMSFISDWFSQKTAPALIPHWSTLLKSYSRRLFDLECGVQTCAYMCCVCTAGLASRHTADPHPFHMAADARHGHPQPRAGRGARLTHGSPRPRQSAGFRLEVSLVWRDSVSSWCV